MNGINVMAVLSIVAAPLAAQVSSPAAASSTTSTTVKPFSAADEARFMALGRRARAFLLKSQADSLITMLDSASAAEMGGVSGIGDLMAETEDRAGTVTQMLLEKMTRRNGSPQFWYEANFSNFTDEPVVLRFVFSDDGKIVGIGMGPKSQAKWDQ